MIRDTSGQDRPLTKPVVARPWQRRAVQVIVAAAAIAGIVYVIRGWLGAEKSVAKDRIRIAKVERGTLVRDVVADGRVVAANSPTLYAIAPGIVDFHVRAGDKVTKGQKLATVASPELQSKLTQELATLAGLDAAVGRAGLDIEHGNANANMAAAQAEVDRQTASREVQVNQQMFERGVIPELEFRRSQDLLKKAELALAHAKAEAALQRKGLTFDLGTKQQGLDRQREVVRDLQRQVDALEIASPVDGQVGQLLIPQRATVAANAPVISVVDLGAFELEIKVPDAFARDLALGMTADIKSGNQSFAGKVRSVSPEVIDGNVATRLEFGDKRPDGLRQNQRLTARILIEERPNVLKVERGPFLESTGGNYAYFVDGDYAERRPIKTGALSLDAVELLGGAQPGDQIIVTSTEAFGNASRLRIAE